MVQHTLEHGSPLQKQQLCEAGLQMRNIFTAKQLMSEGLSQTCTMLSHFLSVSRSVKYIFASNTCLVNFCLKA